MIVLRKRKSLQLRRKRLCKSDMFELNILTFYLLYNLRSPLVMTLTMCAVLVGQPMFKCCLLSLVSSNKEEGEEDDGADEEGEGYSRFIPLLLFLVQKKETSLPAKLSVMVTVYYLFIVCTIHVHVLCGVHCLAAANCFQIMYFSLYRQSFSHY